MKTKFPYLWLLVAPFALYQFGAFLNYLVITVNGGTMPVVLPAVDYKIAGMMGETLSPGQLIDAIHAVMSSSAHLKFLADWIQIPGVGTASPGDLFLWFSDWVQNYALGACAALTWKSYNPTS